MKCYQANKSKVRYRRESGKHCESVISRSRVTNLPPIKTLIAVVPVHSLRSPLLKFDSFNQKLLLSKNPVLSSRSTNEASTKEAGLTPFALGLDSATVSKMIFNPFGSG